VENKGGKFLLPNLRRRKLVEWDRSHIRLIIFSQIWSLTSDELRISETTFRPTIKISSSATGSPAPLGSEYVRLATRNQIPSRSTQTQPTSFRSSSTNLTFTHFIVMMKQPVFLNVRLIADYTICLHLFANSVGTRLLRFYPYDSLADLAHVCSQKRSRSGPLSSTIG